MIEVFLADDDVDDCQLFGQALAQLDVESNFTMVHDGEQLLHLLRLPSKSVPDVIFLDLNMPRKNGFETLIEIRDDYKFKNIPVVIYSTSFDKTALDNLYNAGAHYVIRKPSKYSQIRLILEKALHLVVNISPSQPTREGFVLTMP